MTWNWKWKVAATGITALAGWMASEPLQTPSARTPPPAARAADIPGAATAAAVSDIEEQARRLVRPASSSPLPSTDRNLFRYQPKPQPRPTLKREPPPVIPVQPVRVPFPLRLAGIAVDTVNGVTRRTAIITGPASLELAAEGAMAAPGYRVVTVGETFAEIERLSDGTRERLNLKP
jgi:hypothetical protein